MNGFKEYKVGNIYQEALGHSEGIVFDVTDEGAVLVLYYDVPTAKEIKNIKSGKMQIRMTAIDKLAIMLFKFGSLDWCDAPYSPHLSKMLTHIDEISSTSGLALTTYLFDTATGKLEVLRLTAIPHDVSVKLVGHIKNNSVPMRRDEYISVLQKYYRMSVDDLVRKSKA